MKKKWICTICGYVHEGDTPPEICPVCKQPAEKFQEYEITEEQKPALDAVCTLLSARNVSTFIKEFILQLPEGEIFDFKPGSFVHVHIPAFDIRFADMDIDVRFHPDWDKYKVWDLSCRNDMETIRTYSMANYPAEGNIIKLNVRIATPPIDRTTGTWQEGIIPGIGSSWLFSLKPGAKIRLTGPYGDFHIKETNDEMVYIGGGSGMAPLRSQLLHLFKTLETTQRKISYWYGARSKNEIFYEEDFRQIEKDFPNFKFHIALSDPLPEDNWTGYTGFIHQVLWNNYLQSHPEVHKIEYYMCGPGPMANAVREMLDKSGIPPEQLFSDNF